MRLPKSGGQRPEIAARWGMMEVVIMKFDSARDDLRTRSGAPGSVLEQGCNASVPLHISPDPSPRIRSSGAGCVSYGGYRRSFASGTPTEELQPKAA